MMSPIEKLWLFGVVFIVGCVPLMAGWKPPSTVYMDLDLHGACFKAWSAQLTRYEAAVQSKATWTVLGEFPMKDQRLPASFSRREATWVLKTLRPLIARETGKAASRVDDDSFFGLVIYRLFSDRLTHVCAVEATFPHRLIRNLKSYGGIGGMWIDGKPVNPLPEGVPEISFGGVADLSGLDPSRAYVEELPGYPFSAILFHVSSGGQHPSLDAWWRFVFTPSEQSCFAAVEP